MKYSKLQFSLLPLHRQNSICYLLKEKERSHFQLGLFTPDDDRISPGHTLSPPRSQLCSACIPTAAPTASCPRAVNRQFGKDCWAHQHYFPLPKGVEIRGGVPGSLLHDLKAILPLNQMLLQQHQCHRGSLRGSAPGAKTSTPRLIGSCSPLSPAYRPSGEGKPASPSLADRPKLIILAPARGSQDFRGGGN